MKTKKNMQNKIAEIFDKDRTAITKHINKILKDDEVDEKSNVQKMHIANSDKPATLAFLNNLKQTIELYLFLNLKSQRRKIF